MFSRFNSLENEVRKRDEIISQLQKRIQELERLGLSGLSPSSQLSGDEDPDPEHENKPKPAKNGGSSGSEEGSCAEGFMVSIELRYKMASHFV